MALLEVRDLATTFKTEDGLVRAVNGLSFSVEAGTTLGIVGESGSGKSVTSLSIMRLIPQPPGKIERGQVLLRGEDLLEKSESEMRKIRGADIAMIFQDPMTSLNPVLTVGEQIAEATRLHLGYSKKTSIEKAIEMLKLVRIPAPEKRVFDYPHQFSGGMRQRVMIAMALSCDPAVLIADEPTTALDVTIQAQIIELMNEMQQRLGSAIVLITHDLGVVAETCKNVLVMYGGNMVEYGSADDIFNRPKMPYTMGLLESVPRLDSAGERLVPIDGQPPNLLRMPPGCAFAPRCRYKMPLCDTPVPLYDFGGGHVARCYLYDERAAGQRTLDVETAPADDAGSDLVSVSESLVVVRDLTKYFPITAGLLQRKVGDVKAVDGIDFDIRRGETLGLVGESGSGKTTAGRVILRLADPTSGTIAFEGRDISTLSRAQLRPLRKEMQIIFQDPYASLNPRMTVGDIVREPLTIHHLAAGKDADKRVQELLSLVGLQPYHANRYPHEFSGGQRQRIGIARALAVNPKFIVADEPVSALDVSIQAQVINLLQDLQKQLNLTFLFIAHDLSVVRHISNRVAVMYVGKIIEIADRDRLYANPLHPYTQALLSAIPIPDPAVERRRKRIILTGDIPSPVNPPSGCRFHTRCPIAFERCTVEVPAFNEYETGHRAACHWVEERGGVAPDLTYGPAVIA